MTVVFDGYPNFPTTKLQEQERRATKMSSHTILFNENTVYITQQSEFLANPQNKKRLIEAVKTKTTEEDMNVVSTEKDADTIIVDQARRYVLHNNTTVIVGTDTDILVLLVALAPQSEATIFILKPSLSESAFKVYYVDFLVHKYLDQRTLLLFAHSMTGCGHDFCIL